MKVAFIGLGNMGASLAKAVAKEVASTDLLLVNRSPQKVEEFISQYGGTASDLEQVFQEAEVIFLGVKPYQICPLLEEYQGILAQRSNLLLVSMAAGLELERMASVVKNERVGLIRIMPNTPVAIGQGVISLSPLPSSDRPATSPSQTALSRSRGPLRNRRKIDGSCNGYRRLWSSLCLSDDRSHGGCRSSLGTFTRASLADGGPDFQRGRQYDLRDGATSWKLEGCSL